MSNNKPTFTHEFKTDFGVINISGAQGYMKALNQVMKHINEKAIRKDTTLYVNASELYEVCHNTFSELTDVVDQELNKFSSDNLFNTIANIVKKDAKDRYGIDINKPDSL